jgi:hypothetical protein
VGTDSKRKAQMALEYLLVGAATLSLGGPLAKNSTLEGCGSQATINQESKAQSFTFFLPSA